jgi:hypothetical protein
MKRMRRKKVKGCVGIYHCMSRVVNGQMLFKDREKEMLRKMIWQLADFSGVEVLTYCVMSNHFHVLLRVPAQQDVDDQELMRRYKVLYPKPTKFQADSVQVLTSKLQADADEAEVIRRQLLARMGDISQYMKAVKQRFSVWYNRNNDRFGTLWADRFKSVLVEGQGNPLQTMAAYIDLNPVRAGLVDDPKDYRFCGYAQGVAGDKLAVAGLGRVWSDYDSNPLRAHRLLIFGKGSEDSKGSGHVIEREKALRVLEQEGGLLPKAAILRCRVRYFTDGAIFGSAEFVRGFTSAWQMERKRQYPPKVNLLKGAQWGDLAVIQGLRKQVFG